LKELIAGIFRRLEQPCSKNFATEVTHM